jgi:hypothetical protein
MQRKLPQPVSYPAAFHLLTFSSLGAAGDSFTSDAPSSAGGMAL